MLACAQEPVDNGGRALTVDETERLWKTDRARLEKVNGCFRRLICQYQDVRKNIGKTEGEVVCHDDEKRK